MRFHGMILKLVHGVVSLDTGNDRMSDGLLHWFSTEASRNQNMGSGDASGPDVMHVLTSRTH